MRKTLSFRHFCEAGMTKRGIALSPHPKKFIETIHPNLSPFTPYFCKRLNG
jgi:hypothetical protein